MNPPLHVIFGRTFHDITEQYINGIGAFISPIFHISAFLIILLSIILGNKVKKIFTIYFLINYIWLFGYVGIYMTILFFKVMGYACFMFWGMIPILLFIITFFWLKELKDNRIDLDFKKIKITRIIVIPVIIFGYWYPTYVYGSGFKFIPKDLLFSFFGLMPCPTTMVALGLLLLIYPNVNKPLVYSLTIFAVCVGTAQLFIRFVPDYPLAIIGYYSLIIIIIEKIKLIINKRKSSDI